MACHHILLVHILRGAVGCGHTNMACRHILLVALTVCLCNGNTSGEYSCTNSCNCDGPLANAETILRKLDLLVGLPALLEEMKTQQADLKDHILKRLDAQDLKLELSLTSGQQGMQLQNDQINPTRQPDNLPNPKDCQEVLQRGSTRSGVYRISPDGMTKINVYCEQELDGGGWTVFQHRKDGSLDFYRLWTNYKTGFGELTGEFWLGNDNIHLLTKDHDKKLKIELRYHQEVTYADYTQFCIANEDNKYKLFVSGFSGSNPPGDRLLAHNQSDFSTKDRDNDVHSSHCAQTYKGGWWYNSCHHSNLNGVYGSTADGKGVNWYSWKGNTVSLTGTRMMVKKRP